MFVGATIGRPFWFCGCLRATNGRPYGKLAYEKEPNRPLFLYTIILSYLGRQQLEGVAVKIDKSLAAHFAKLP